ncbi:hypothetical protein V6N13_107155 [Hibiscus sabdariffa]|uniref:HTH La-type RNA-binding domain-containing protein n=1 Tax=Hibiscus sabdariffa TaxID=183260 RepID=A0ABR2F323_9ROSI
MAANINTANFSTSAVLAAATHSPGCADQLHRAATPVSSTWTQIVRGETESPAAVPLSPSLSYSSSPSTAVIEPPVTTVVEAEVTDDVSAVPNANAGKKPAWNKPSDGAAESGPIMGGHMWPALSESARVSSKSTSDSSRALSDGSDAPLFQGSGNTLLLSSSPKQVSNNEKSKSNSTPSHTPARQMSMKRSSNNTASNGGLLQPPLHCPVVEALVNSPSSRDHRSGFGSQLGNDNPRNSFRHRNGGLHPHGYGSHHQNYGGRRNQAHGNQDWNGRNFNSRNAHMQPSIVPRLVRHHPPVPQPNSSPFIAPPPVQPFGTRMGFPELASQVYIIPAPPPESLRGVPFVAPMPPVFFPAREPPDHQLHVKIGNQIDYYFSNENLIKDIYLRQNMDDQGWVPLKLIASFRKVSLLTDNIQLIRDVLRSSTVVEVQGEKVRKRIDWMKWIMPPSIQFPIRPGQDRLGDQRTADESGARTKEDAGAGLTGRSSSGEFNNHSQVFSSEGTQGVASRVTKK